MREEFVNVEFGIGDIAPATARNAELLSEATIFLEDEDFFTMLCRSAGSHHTSRTSTDDNDVKKFVL